MIVARRNRALRNAEEGRRGGLEVLNGKSIGIRCASHSGANDCAGDEGHARWARAGGEVHTGGVFAEEDQRTGFASGGISRFLIKQGDAEAGFEPGAGKTGQIDGNRGRATGRERRWQSDGSAGRANGCAAGRGIGTLAQSHEMSWKSREVLNGEGERVGAACDHGALHVGSG